MRFLVTNRQFKDGGWSKDRNPAGLSFWTCASAEWQQAQSWDQVASQAFMSALAETGKPPILFVHGFNNSWGRADDTLSAIQDDLQDYQAILFSWISEGRMDPIAYEQDRARARESAKDLLNAILLLDQPNVIAHSMGNYVLQLAIQAAANSAQSKPLITSLAMVAADIDNTALRDRSFEAQVKRGMVFYCLNDGALDGSALLHAIELNGLPRLGMTGPLGHPANFTAVDCTGKLTDVLDPIRKHGAYFTKAWFYAILRTILAGVKAAAA